MRDADKYWAMQNLKRSDLQTEGLNLETLMEALFYRDEFLSIASHELKTPLTSMRLHTQVFKRYSTKDQSLPYSKDNVDRLVNQIDAQTSRLIKLVEDMLDISRIRSGQLCMTKDDFNVSDLLHDVVLKFSLNQINRISLKVDTNLFLWGDCERVAQVFHNIINNALKFSKDLPIVVTLIKKKTKISFSVKDQGHGISQENQKRIFHRFQRGISASEVSGLGLGLYIAREIVESHNGKISVKSCLEKGSTFTVDFIPKELL
jgi:signal transduction histidine kinase